MLENNADNVETDFKTTLKATFNLIRIFFPSSVFIDLKCKTSYILHPLTTTTQQ